MKLKKMILERIQRRIDESTLKASQSNNLRTELDDAGVEYNTFGVNTPGVSIVIDDPPGVKKMIEPTGYRNDFLVGTERVVKEYTEYHSSVMNLQEVLEMIADIAARKAVGDE